MVGRAPGTRRLGPKACHRPDSGPGQTRRRPHRLHCRRSEKVAGGYRRVASRHDVIGSRGSTRRRSRDPPTASRSLVDSQATRAASSCKRERRGVGAERSARDRAWRPDGERNIAPSTTCQSSTAAGSNPSASSSRSASVVRPSPQHLSRGNVAVSTKVTSRPPVASVIAAATPAGPAPTTSTSVVVPATEPG